MKILMTLMGLEIGGAETHVVELSKKLSEMGNTVIVASSGGVYEAELADADIRHIKLPLATKDPFSMLKSYWGLRKLIKNENFDIVHAHARIPAFICGLLSKTMGFKFITTAHFDFKMSAFYKKISDWGEYQLAVSHDLKNYLIQNYKITPDNISVTINGIDTDKFSAEKDCSALIKELGLNPDAKRVLYVGRIDTEVAHAALLLAQNAYKIAKAHPSAEVIIVGGGTAFEQLSEYADKSNIVAGYKCVTVTGPRTDIADFTALCDVFVGVSRAALEAMAAKRPTVLAGAQGYMGIFDESKLECAQANNFTCRGQVIPDDTMIIDDVNYLLGLDKAELQKLGNYNCEVVKKYYSVAKMAEDYMSVYKSAGTSLKEKGDVIISGYYGFGNLGDDTLLSSLIASLRNIKPDLKITVLCKNPKNMSRLYGARCINRYDFPAIKREMKSAKLLINGGGNLIQDGTSKKSLFYYTSIMKLAKSCGLKTVLYANGIGPLYNDISRKRAADVINEADLITLRDPESLELIRKIGCNEAADRTVISADPAFCGIKCDPKWTEFILKRENLSSDGKYFMISVRSGNTLQSSKENYDQRVIDNLTEAVNIISKKYFLTPIFVPFQKELDTYITEKIAQKCPAARILSDLSASELCGVIDICEFVISMRLHLLIFAAAQGVPMIGLSYDKKVDSFLEYIDIPYLCDIRSFESSDVEKMADEIIAGKDNITSNLLKRSTKLRSLSANDAKAVINML